MVYSVFHPKHRKYSIYFTFYSISNVKRSLVLKEHFAPKKMKDIWGFYNYYFEVDIMIFYNHGTKLKNMQILCYNKAVTF